MLLRVGALAKRAGLTVRTLHHYDTIGLLSPTARSASGFRLYSEDDVVRLHRIQALKQLGYALADIQALLVDGYISPLEILDRQIQALADQAQHAQALQQGLMDVREQISRGKPTDMADWLTILERMTVYAKHFSQEELQTLRARDGERGRGVTWVKLRQRVRKAISDGLTAASPEAQQLAQQWMQQVAETTDNNMALALKLGKLYKQERRAGEIDGVTPEMIEWIAQAFTYARVAALAPYVSATELELVRQRQFAHLKEWPHLIADVRTAMDAGTRPDDAQGQALAERWRNLFRASYCGDDPVLEAKIRAALQGEAGLLGLICVGEQLISFIHQAMTLRYESPRSAADQLPPPPKPTAFAVASLRAAHQFLDSPLIFEDALAHRVLGLEGDPRAHFAAPQYDDGVARVMRTSLAVRSRLAEDEWAHARQAGIRQYVILGAGLDTYAYREPQPAEVRVFEVDLPASQHWKRACLRRAAIAEPEHLTFVPIDFTRATLAEGLAAAGFNQAEPAFFSWLGVAVYLDEADVLSTLRYIASCAPGSAVVFDYALPPASLSPREHLGWQLITARTAAVGEPWKSYFDPVVLSTTLGDMGFGRVESFSREQLQERYLAGREDGLRLGSLSRLMCATV